MKTYLFLLFTTLNFFIFSQSLKGKVEDNQGLGIPFAKIRVNNSGYGTVTNALGEYVLELKNGKYEIIISAPGFQSILDTIEINQSFHTYNLILKPTIQELGEIVVISKTKKERGKEIMKQVIDKRSYFNDLLSEYTCDTYCFASLEKDKLDTLISRSLRNHFLIF